MPFNILELGKDVSSLIWKKLNNMDKVMILFSTKGIGNEYFIKTYESRSDMRKFMCVKSLTKYGYLDIIKILDLKGAITFTRDYFYSTVSLCTIAAENGHLEVLKLLKEKGVKWDADTSASAAREGHFETLRWLKENDCPCDARVCSSIVAIGDLEMLKWARENECPWDIWTCTVAGMRGHLHIKEWAQANGCPCHRRSNKK